MLWGKVNKNDVSNIYFINNNRFKYKVHFSFSSITQPKLYKTRRFQSGLS